MKGLQVPTLVAPARCQRGADAQWYIQEPESVAHHEIPTADRTFKILSICKHKGHSGQSGMCCRGKILLGHPWALYARGRVPYKFFDVR